MLTLAVAMLSLASLGGATAFTPAPPEVETKAEEQYRAWLTSQGIEFGPVSVACALASAGDAGPYIGLCYANNEDPGVIAHGAGSSDGVTLAFTELEEAAPAGTTTGVGVTTTTGAASATSFGPGIQLVGTDIQPGTYRAVVPEGDLVLCTWQRLSGLSGESDDIITIDLASDPGAQVVVEIQPSDVAFDSSGCGNWTLVE